MNTSPALSSRLMFRWGARCIGKKMHTRVSWAKLHLKLGLQCNSLAFELGERTKQSLPCTALHITPLLRAAQEFTKKAVACFPVCPFQESVAKRQPAHTEPLTEKQLSHLLRCQALNHYGDSSLCGWEEHPLSHQKGYPLSLQKG